MVNYHQYNKNYYLTICDLVLKEKVNYIEIDWKKYEIEDVTVAEITKHKNIIISSALKCLND